VRIALFSVATRRSMTRRAAIPIAAAVAMAARPQPVAASPIAAVVAAR